VSKFGDTLGGDRASSEVYLEVVDGKAVDWEGGTMAIETLIISQSIWRRSIGRRSNGREARREPRL